MSIRAAFYKLELDWMKIVLFGPIFILFFFQSISFLDPDFWWRMRVGTIINTQGIPKTDPLSYSMSSFPYVDHSWLTDSFVARIYPIVGYQGLGLISALLALICLGAVSYKKYNLISVLLVASALFVSPRPFIISWLFSIILIRAILDKKLWQKCRWITPGLFCLWANLHGGFSLGLVIYLWFVISRVASYRKIDFVDVALFTLSTLATLVNPYGPGLWREVLATTTDSSLRFTISEWLPTVFSFNPAVVTLFVLSGVIVHRYRNKFGLFLTGLFIFLFLTGISSVRNVPFLALVAGLVISDGLNFFQAELGKDKISLARWKIARRFLLGGVITLFGWTVFSNFHSFQGLTEEKYYPTKATAFLKTNLPDQEIFSTYGWGGYLGWKLPEKKVFIDGRMPSWRRTKEVRGEVKDAFGEYQNILYGKTDFEKISDKFNIGYVLLPKQKGRSSWVADLEEKIALLFGEKNPDFNFQKNLLANGWKIIYTDDLSEIYARSR